MIRFDRKSLEKSFNDSIAKAVRASFAAGEPIYGRDRITGRPMLVYRDGRRIEVTLEKPT